MKKSKAEVAKAGVASGVEKIKGYLPHREVEKKPGALVRALHDIGLATWFGGTVMGVLAMNPAVEVLDDPEERGKMVDEGWARFQPFGALGLFTAFVAHIIMRRRGPKKATQTYKNVALIQDVCALAAIGSSIASLALGEYTVHADPDGYTPIESATTPTEETPDDVEKAQGGLSIASWVQLASGVALFACAAILQAERDKM